jgi:hypothetical protein
MGVVGWQTANMEQKRTSVDARLGIDEHSCLYRQSDRVSPLTDKYQVASMIRDEFMSHTVLSAVCEASALALDRR